MARKRLSDLLKQEVESQGSPENSGSTSSSPPAPLVALDDSVTNADPEPAAKASALTPDAMAEIQNQLDTLKTALAQQKVQAEKLKQQLGDRQQLEEEHSQAMARVKELEQSLLQQKNVVKKLESEVAQAEQLKAALTEEKSLVAKLYAKIEALEEEPTPPPNVVALAPWPNAMPKRYIAPQQPSTKLSDDDIGWFD